MIKRAPFWLIAILLVLVVFNVYTVVGAFKMLAAFAAFDLPFSPAIRMLFGLIWTAIFSAIAVGLWLKQQIAFRWVAPTLTCYGATNFGWLIAFARSDYSRNAIGFQAIVTVFVLIPIWILTVRWKWLGKSVSSEVDNASLHE